MEYKEFLIKVLNSPINLYEINKRINTYITNSDIEKMFGKEACKYILLYNNLFCYKSIN
jgi:hypothetical protein